MQNAMQNVEDEMNEYIRNASGRNHLIPQYENWEEALDSLKNEYPSGKQLSPSEGASFSFNQVLDLLDTASQAYGFEDNSSNWEDPQTPLNDDLVDSLTSGQYEEAEEWIRKEVLN